MTNTFRYFFCIVSLWLGTATLFAQKHDYHQVTGYNFNSTNPFFGNIRIDFNFSPPKIIKENLRMNFQSTHGSFSDSTGHLMFYTNGIRIFSHNNQLMVGGDTINPGSVWNNSQQFGYVQTSIVAALPLPGAEHIYYLFHNGLQLGGPNQIFSKYFYYTIIDMKANNGLGKVIAKNQVLMEGDVMWPAFVKHGNGRDWWIMGMQRADTKHSLYLLSPEGLTGPYIQDLGPPFLSTEFEGESLFSEDGTLFLRHDTKTALRLYDFDRCSGELSNLRVIPFQEPLHSYYAAFSPDSRFLYLNRPGWVWSLDLKAPDLSASYDTVAAFEFNSYPTFPWDTGYGFNQLGPDGKIYWSNWTSTRAMNVMHRPNLPGDAADCEEEGLILPRWNYIGVCQFPNYRLGEWEDSPCDTINGQIPGNGFIAVPYEPMSSHRDTGYLLLPPIAGGRCDDCSEKDLEMLNNPMAAVYARMYLEQTGKLPDDWPKEKAEREGLIIALPQIFNLEKPKNDE